LFYGTIAYRDKKVVSVFITFFVRRFQLYNQTIFQILNHINTIEVQNAKLKNIAWTQSHVVRAPLSRNIRIIDLIEGETENFTEMLFWLKQLRIFKRNG
jgi:hypothetical protein